MATVYGGPPLHYTISDTTLREELVDPDGARRWAEQHPDDGLTTAVLRILGDLDEALTHGRARLEQLGEDTPRWGAALMRLGHVHHWRGEYDAASHCFDRSQEVFERTGDASMVAFARQHRAKALYDQHRYADALSEAQAAARLREDLAGREDPALLATAHQTLTRISAVASTPGSGDEAPETTPGRID